MNSARNWMFVSGCIFVFGVAFFAFKILKDGALPSLEKAIWIGVILVAAAIAAPARIFASKVREERAQNRKRLEDTFK